MKINTARLDETARHDELQRLIKEKFKMYDELTPALKEILLKVINDRNELIIELNGRAKELLSDNTIKKELQKRGLVGVNVGFGFDELNYYHTRYSLIDMMFNSLKSVLKEYDFTDTQRENFLRMNKELMTLDDLDDNEVKDG